MYKLCMKWLTPTYPYWYIKRLWIYIEVHRYVNPYHLWFTQRFVQGARLTVTRISTIANFSSAFQRPFCIQDAALRTRKDLTFCVHFPSTDWQKEKSLQFLLAKWITPILDVSINVFCDSVLPVSIVLNNKRHRIEVIVWSCRISDNLFQGQIKGQDKPTEPRCSLVVFGFCSDLLACFRL